jgi:hypothetical protein
VLRMMQAVITQDHRAQTCSHGKLQLPALGRLGCGCGCWVAAASRRSCSSCCCYLPLSLLLVPGAAAAYAAVPVTHTRCSSSCLLPPMSHPCIHQVTGAGHQGGGGAAHRCDADGGGLAAQGGAREVDAKVSQIKGQLLRSWSRKHLVWQT